PDTMTCSVQTFPNGPQNAVPANTSGTFGRFRYFPALNAYAVVSEADLNSFMLRLSTAAPTGDVTPPTVSMATPANGTTVSGTVTLSANASDNVGVAAVQFRVDGANVGPSITTAPYSFSWDTTTAANASHAITATAVDTSGNAATSPAVTVTVK